MIIRILCRHTQLVRHDWEVLSEKDVGPGLCLLKDVRCRTCGKELTVEDIHDDLGHPVSSGRSGSDHHADGEGIRLRIDVDDGHEIREGVCHFTVGAGSSDPKLTFADGSRESIPGGVVRYGEIGGHSDE